MLNLQLKNPALQCTVVSYVLSRCQNLRARRAHGGYLIQQSLSPNFCPVLDWLQENYLRHLKYRFQAPISESLEWNIGVCFLTAFLDDLYTQPGLKILRCVPYAAKALRNGRGSEFVSVCRGQGFSTCVSPADSFSLFFFKL